MSCGVCGGLCSQCLGQGLGRKIPAGVPDTLQHRPDPPCHHPPAVNGRRCCPWGWRGPSPRSRKEGETQDDNPSRPVFGSLEGSAKLRLEVGVIPAGERMLSDRSSVGGPSTWMTTKR